MEHLFLGTFLFGLLFTLVAGVLGATHGGHGDAGGLPAKLSLETGSGHAHAHADGHTHAWLPPWLPRLNLTAAIGFLTWFGGAGWLALTQAGVGPWLATLAGLVAGWPAYRLIAAFYGLLEASARVRHAADDRLDGVLARVSVGAEPGQVGEIVFVLNGQQRVEGARALEGGALQKGATVVVTGYEEGLALVHPTEPWLQLDGSRSPEAGKMPQPEARQPEDHP